MYSKDKKQSDEFSYDYIDLICYWSHSIYIREFKFMENYFGSWSPFYYRLNDSDETKREIAKQEIIKLNNTTSQNIQKIWNI